MTVQCAAIAALRGMARKTRNERGRVGMKSDGERARQPPRVVDHAHMDERRDLAEFGAYLARAVALGLDAAPARAPPRGARPHDDPERKLGELPVAAHVASERRNRFDLERVAPPFAVDAGGKLAGVGQKLPGAFARQGFDHARRGILEKALGEAVLGLQRGRRLEQAFGDEVFDERISLHGIDAEVLAEASRADPRPLGRQPDDAREHACAPGAQIERVHAEIEPLRDQGSCLHTRPRRRLGAMTIAYLPGKSKSAFRPGLVAAAGRPADAGRRRKRYAIASAGYRSRKIQKRGGRLPVITPEWRR